jgi:hypothetical protein
MDLAFRVLRFVFWNLFEIWFFEFDRLKDFWRISF